MIFREEEKDAEIVGETMDKHIIENVMVAKCKVPKEALRRMESKIVENWNVQNNFDYFDNLKIIKRK